MARLRVGDIEIDGANISIGGVPQVPVTAPPAGGAAADGTPMETTTTVASHRGATVVTTHSRPAAPTALARAPSTALARTAPGTALARDVDRPGGDGLDGLAALPVSERLLVGGGLALAAGGAAILAFTVLAFAMMMVLSGAGAVTLGLLKGHAVRRRAARQAAAAERELAVHADALRPLLGEARPEQTVEWIAAKAALPAPTVVRALAFMRDRGEVVEELCTDSGEWYYGLVPALPGPALALDERLALIDGAERKP